MADRQLTVGDVREAIKLLPDDAPLCNDVLEGPDNWTVEIAGVQGDIPEHWKNVGNAHELPQHALWVHTRIVPMEEDEDADDGS